MFQTITRVVKKFGRRAEPRVVTVEGFYEAVFSSRLVCSIVERHVLPRTISVSAELTNDAVVVLYDSKVEDRLSVVILNAKIRSCSRSKNVVKAFLINGTFKAVEIAGVRREIAAVSTTEQSRLHRILREIIATLPH